MKFEHAIGIDVSKNTLDVVCHLTGSYTQVANNRAGLRQLISWVKKQVNKRMDQTLFCFEHTGLYSHELALFLEQQQLCFTVQSALAIKRRSERHDGSPSKFLK